jgi:hypothetical protein
MGIVLRTLHNSNPWSRIGTVECILYTDVDVNIVNMRLYWIFCRNTMIKSCSFWSLYCDRISNTVSLSASEFSSTVYTSLGSLTIPSKIHCR